MNKKIIIALIALFSISTKSVAADIAGQVTTAEGQPICALVLASGISMFTCNPIGQYSLQGLALEPDSSINLQVYADGFLPYIKKLTQFGSQPPVVMTRAVDNGLSSSGPLDGTYRLIRASVIFNDGTGFDTVQMGVEGTGTMVINGGSLVQDVALTINGVAQPPVIIRNNFVDNYYYLNLFDEATGGFIYSVSITQRGNKFVTFANSNVSGFPFTEVDQWAKVTSKVISLESDVSVQSYTPATSPAGTLLGAMGEGQGLKLMPDK